MMKNNNSNNNNKNAMKVYETIKNNIFSSELAPLTQDVTFFKL